MQPIIDLAQLDDQTFGDHALRRDILVMFRDQAPSLMAAIEAGEGTTRSELAHRLKGSCLAIGAIALAQAAADIDEMPASSHALASARPVFEATMTEISSLLDA